LIILAIWYGFDYLNW